MKDEVLDDVKFRNKHEKRKKGSIVPKFIRKEDSEIY